MRKPKNQMLRTAVFDAIRPSLDRSPLGSFSSYVCLHKNLWVSSGVHSLYVHKESHSFVVDWCLANYNMVEVQGLTDPIITDFVNKWHSQQPSNQFPVAIRTTFHAGTKNANSCMKTTQGSEATANILIKCLDEKRQERWIETVESLTSHTPAEKLGTLSTASQEESHLNQTSVPWVQRDGFKTQPPIDRRFHPVPAGFYCSKQWQPPRTGRNRRSTGGWVWSRP